MTSTRPSRRLIPHSGGPRGPASFIARFILVCFFASGLTGLIYEVLWTRMIVKIIGGSPLAVSIVLTVFMGGLGLGSYAASRTVDRIQQPMRLVRVYGLLELVVAGYCLVLPLLLRALTPLYAILYDRLFGHSVLYGVLTLAGCSLLLLIPATCMGATLPVLCRFTVSRLSHLGTHVGRLYGLNTLGAAAGALVTGFWLIERLGIPGTLTVAVMINGLIGLLCVWISLRLVPEPVSVTPEGPGCQGPGQEASCQGGGGGRAVVVAALGVFAVSGFCSMAYEVIWTRLLGLIVGPTTYSFTLVVVTFITSLALGSLVFGWLADKVRHPLSLLVWTQLAAALLALGVSQVLGNSQLLAAKILYRWQGHFALMSAVKGAWLFAFMFPPALLLGATFPLVGRIYAQSLSSVGRSLGVAYAVNTGGAVLGSLCAGIVLIPLMGKERALGLVISLQIVTSLVIVAAMACRRPRSLWMLAAFAGCALAGLALCVRYPVWDRHQLSVGKYDRFSSFGVNLDRVGWFQALFQGNRLLAVLDRSELLYYGDGIGGFTTVLRFPASNGVGEPRYTMTNSGKPDASSYTDMATQTLLAHAPMLSHPHPKDVMVLGLASGITAGEVLRYPVERLDVLEISPQVVEASAFFEQWNNRVLSDPRTHLIVQDGRAHLQLTRRTYDVIISEPSNPWMAGLATLFTSDFFTLVRDRLEDKGVFAQWIHAYAIDWPTFAMVGRTFARVFPHSALLVTDPSGRGGDYLLVGFKGQDRSLLSFAAQGLPALQGSSNVSLRNPDVLYGLVVSEDLDRLFGQGPVNTDSRPWLEFAAPRLLYSDEAPIARVMAEGAWVSPATQAKAQRDIDTQTDLAAYAFSVHRPFAGMVDLAAATPQQRERFFEMAEAYSADNAVDFTRLGDAALQRRCRLAQVRGIEARLDTVPDKAETLLHMAGLYADLGMIEQAVRSCEKVLDLRPNMLAALNNLAWDLAVYRDAAFHNPRRAIELAERACTLSGYRSAKAIDTLAVAYAASGQYARARDMAQRALSLLQSARDQNAAREIRERLDLYERDRPYTAPRTP